MFDTDELSQETSLLYQLYSLNRHGRPSEDEYGLARYIANTASSLDSPIWDQQGQFDHTYGAIAEDDQEICVYGILRPRFRVTNPLNAGTFDAWHSVLDRDHEAFRLIQSLRLENDLPELPNPFMDKD